MSIGFDWNRLLILMAANAPKGKVRVPAALYNNLQAGGTYDRGLLWEQRPDGWWEARLDPAEPAPTRRNGGFED